MRNQYRMVLGVCAWRTGNTVLLPRPKWPTDPRKAFLMVGSSEELSKPVGKPKSLFRRSLSTQAFTLVVGILIMVLTLYCNNWVIRAKTVFTNLERVNSAFDSFDRTDLVVMYDLCDQNGEAVSWSDLARVVRIGNTIQRHEALLEEAHNTSIELINGLQLPKFSGPNEDLGSIGPIDWSKVEGGQVAATPMHASGGSGAPDLSKPQEKLGMPLMERDIVCNKYAKDPVDLMSNFQVWQTSLREFSSQLRISRGEGMFTGKGPGANDILAQKLRSKMTIVTHWWLPVLNGALGAVIFCLTKMIKDKSVAPRLGEVLLRMVFGGFAGIVVSTLLLPSGVPMGPYVDSAPGVSLLAFIFGFSLDSFIQLLERLNQLVIESTRPKNTDG